MRAIDATGLRNQIMTDAGASDMPSDWYKGVQFAVDHIVHAPTIEPEIIYCRECKHSTIGVDGEAWICAHPQNNCWRIHDNHFCGYAQRRAE